MLSVLSKPAARESTHHSEKIGVRHVYPFLTQMLLLAFLKNFQANRNLTKNEKKSLEIFIEQAKALLKNKWKFIMQHLNDQVLLDSFHSMVHYSTKLSFDTLVESLQKIAETHYRKMGVELSSVFECDTIVDAVKLHFENNEVFMDIFDKHVWVFFRTDLKVANQMARQVERLSNLPPKMVSTYAAIVARTAVKVTAELPPVFPTLVSGALRSAPPLLDKSDEIVRVLPDPPRRNDASDLILAGVKEDLNIRTENAIAKSAEAFDAGNRSTVMAITDADFDAQVLATEITRGANQQASAAAATAFAALEVKEAVAAAADAGEPLFNDDAPASSATQLSADAIPSDADSPNPPLSVEPQFDHQNHANGAGGHLSVIPEENDDADQSGTSPLPDGERRAPFTTSAQSPPKGVEDRALGAQTKSSLSNLGSTPSSDPSGTTLIHGLPDLLASLAISSKPSFTLPTKPIVPSPELTDTGVGGAHSSDIQSKNALSTVGVSRNTHADQPSFPPKSDVGGPPVQVLAKSGKPPGSFGGADHLETPSSLKLWSSCIPGGKTSSASQPGNSSSSWSKIFRRRKSNSVNPDPGQTNDTRPPVAHSSGKNLSGSAAANPLMLPSSSSPLGGNIGVSPGAHSPSDPHGFVPLPAPSSSSELGSAAAPALSPQMCPSGHEKGGIERSEEMLDFDDWYFIALQLMRCGVTRSQVQLFSHLAPKFKVTQGLVVA
jgi:hypothetical protein